MFTGEERERLRNDLIAAARADDRISGAAVTGSAALDAEDTWSDIDLAFAVQSEPDQVIAEWTNRMYREHRAVHHMDVILGRTVFRVFLLENTLQVDLAFWSEGEFGATTPKFRLLFGKANEQEHMETRDARHLADLAWLDAFHGRSSIARGRGWQAEYMISTVRDHVLALMCLRHGLPSIEGRGLDQLPAEVISGMRETLVRRLDKDELDVAFRAVMDALITEIGILDVELADRLTPILREVSGTL